MNVIFTNRGTLAVPLSSAQGKGFVVMLEPGVAYPLNVKDVTVVSVGDNPDFFEELSESVKDLIDLVLDWREKSGDDAIPAVAVTIENLGPNGLRVLLGSNVEEYTVQPGVTYEARAPRYVEVRELGV